MRICQHQEQEMKPAAKAIRTDGGYMPRFPWPSYKLNEEPADPAKALEEKYDLKETTSVDDELNALKEELGLNNKPQA
jgi:hypothetical protein